MTKSVAYGDENTNPYRTLSEYLQNSETFLSDGEYIFIGDNNIARHYKYSELFQRARQALALLRDHGLSPNSTVILAIEDPRDFLVTFWACVLGGIVISVAPSLQGACNEQISRLLCDQLRVLNCPICTDCTREKIESIVGFGVDYVDINHYSCCLEDDKYHKSSPDDLLLLIASSGTTGECKLIAHSQQSLVSPLPFEIKQIRERSYSYWYPMSAISGMRFVFPDAKIKLHIKTQHVIKNPLYLLDWIDKYRIKITIVSNFLLRQIINNLTKVKRDWDLSCLDFVVISGEMTDLAVLKHFWRELKPYGLDYHQLVPTYGMSELPIIARYCIENEQDFLLEFCPCGCPVPGVDIRVVDEKGNIVDEQQIGEIQVYSNMMTSGYYKQQISLTDDGWLITGDQGFINDSLLFITGRSKEMIILNAKNYSLLHIEQEVEKIEGVVGCVACVIRAKKTKTDELLLFIHSNKISIALQQEIERHVLQLFGSQPLYIIPIDYNVIPRTRTGKIQRQKLTTQFYDGQFAQFVLSVDDSVPYTAPSNDYERILCRAYSEVFFQKSIGIKHDFFRLGGNSIQALQINAIVEKETGKNIDVTAIYNESTIENFAIYVSKQKNRCDILPLNYKKYPLLPVQKQLWFLCQTSSSFYNLSFVKELKGNLDMEIFRKAVKQLVHRQGALRTVIDMDDGGLVQYIVDREIEVEYIQVESAEYLEREIKETTEKPFVLSQFPLVRFKVIHFKQDEYIFCFAIHHIISDAWSMQIAWDELCEFYNALYEKRSFRLPQLDIHFGDFCVWREKQDIALSSEYWLRKCKDVPILDLPTDKLRPQEQTFTGKQYSIDVSKQLEMKLNKLAQKNDCTLFMVLAAGFNIFLSRYSGQKDIAIGFPIAARHHAGLSHNIGFFVNNVVLRNDLSCELSFLEFLKNVRQNILEGYTHQYYPFEKIVEMVNPVRDARRNPIFQVFLNMLKPKESDDGELKNIEALLLSGDINTANFDITIYVHLDKSLRFVWRYSSDLFVEETIGRMMRHFVQLLDSITINPNRKIHQLPMLSKDEILQPAIYEHIKYVDETVIDLLEKNVLSVPNKTALISSKQQWTFSQLWVLANNVAAALQNAKVAMGSRVALLGDHSFSTVAAMIGILKSGAVCVPLKPDFITGKMQEFLQEVEMILCDESIQKRFNLTQAMTVEHCMSYEQVDRCRPKLYSDQPAFIIYTSGSTGSASGVVITHRNIACKVRTISKSFEITDKDVCVLTASISFVAALRQIFVPLAQQASLVIVEESILCDPQLLFGELARQKISMIDFVPSFCKTCAQILLNSNQEFNLNEIRQIATSGEKLSLDIVLMWRRLIPRVRFLNVYGQTETTAGITVYQVPENTSDVSQNVPVGQTIGQNRIYLLNSHLEPVPQGTIGEIYIESKEIALGYYNNAAYTALKFIANPFGSGILYKAGDQGRYNKENQLEIVSRKDALVKVRGYRVDTIEVEVALRQCEKIIDAAVIFSDEILKAYIVTNESPSYQEVCEYLEVWLPEYMIPQKIMTISSLPITGNGKTDYLTLRELDQDEYFLFSPVWNLSGCLPQQNTKSTYLLFADENTQCESSEVIIVRHGEKFSINDEFHICMDLCSEDDYTKLVDHLCSIDFDFKNLIYSHRSIEILRKLVNAFEGYLPQMQIAVVCRNVFPAKNSTHLIPENAFIVGASRVLPLEYPGLRYACIDIQDKPISNTILCELQLDLPDTNVAYVDDERYTMSYEKIVGYEMTVEDNEVYVITGGLGNIGLHVALSFSQRAKVKIAITTRSKQHISHKEQDTLRMMKEFGCEVMVFETQLKDKLEVAAVVNDIEKKLGKVCGVIHCAGNREHFSMLSKLSITEEKNCFKMRSTQLLIDIFEDKKASFLVVFSSLSSLLGRYGQAEYAAINASLDTLVHKNSTANLRVVSANWDVWKDLPLSLTANTPQDIAQLIQRDAQNGISNKEGINALLALPQLHCNQAIISKRPEIKGYNIRKLTNDICFLVPRTDIEMKICAIWKEVLQVEKIGIEDNFFALGGHSLLVIVVMSKIRKLLGIDEGDYNKLPLTMMLMYPTIKQFAQGVDNFDTRNDIVIQMNKMVVNKSPVFLLHAAGVDPIAYHHLSKYLDGIATTYAIRTDLLDEFSAIEETARYHIEKIKSVQPQGPYFIGGMCMGGLVTYEVARLLRREGDTVKLAFIMDAINIPGMKRYKSRRGHKLRRLGRKIKNLYKIVEFIGRVFICDINFIREKMQRMKNNIKRRVDKVRDPKTKVNKKMRDRLRVVRDGYDPQPYDGEIIYIRSEKEAGKYALARFQELATTVKCHQVKGTIHSDVAYPHFAEATGKIIQMYLQ